MLKTIVYIVSTPILAYVMFLILTVAGLVLTEYLNFKKIVNVAFLGACALTFGWSIIYWDYLWQ